MSSRGTSPVLIGRAAEMAALSGALSSVRQGSPATLLIGGEAGVGKTRLIREFFAVDGSRPLIGACLEIGADGLPFGPFTAMLRDLVRDVGADSVVSMLPGGRPAPELARLLPELAVAGSPAEARVADEAPSAAGAPSAEEARARLFEEFLTLLERLAGDRPVAVVVEDAHWADRSSRELLAFLIRYQRSLRGVAIVVTFRSDELHRTHPLRPLLAELDRIDWVDRIDVPRLTRREAGQLAAAILGSEPPDDLIESLYARAEGNPLFTEALLDAQGGGDLPGSLADLLLRTVRGLPEETQAVLRVVSASSGTVGPELLAAVTGQAVDDLAETLRPAVTGNVLLTSADGYSFRHALIREAVYEDLLPGEPSRIHRRYALAVSQDPSLVPPGRADLVEAYHWHAARDATWALASAWQAARQAGRSMAHAERLMLLARVLDLWDQVPDATSRIGADHVDVLEEAVAAARDAGEDQRGLGFATAAIAELDGRAEREGRAEGEGRAERDGRAEPARVARLLATRASFKRHLALPDSVQDMDLALSMVPESVSPRVRADLLTEFVGASHKWWAQPHIERVVREALGFAREVGDLRTEAKALAALGLVMAHPGLQGARDSEPVRLVAQAWSVAERAAAYEPMMTAAIYESHLLCGAGDYEGAVAAARRGIAAAGRYGVSRTSGAFLVLNEAEPLFALGRWDDALDIIGRALDLVPLPRTRAALLSFSGSIAMARGDLNTAASMAAASRSVLSGLSFDDQFHLPQGQLYLEVSLAAEGPGAAVALAADQLSGYDLATSTPRYLWPFLVTAAGAALAAVSASLGPGGEASAPGDPGDPGAEARALLERLRKIAEELEAFGPVQEAWRLTFTALAGMVAPPGGDALSGSDAVAAWDAVAAAWDALGQPLETAGALARAARAALSGKGRVAPPGEGHAVQSGVDREAAATRIRRAAPIAERLGAQPLSGEITALARRAGVSLADGADGAGGNPLGLTNREMEVLRLVAAGQSNRQIAEALFISPKTASVHISNILGKLGAATRTEAAARAHALRLFEA